MDGQNSTSSRGRLPGLRGDGGAFERHVRRIQNAARRELARRQAATGVRGMIARWHWPILALASLMGLPSVVALRGGPTAAERRLDLALERSLGIPTAPDAWHWPTPAPEEAGPLAPEEPRR